MRLLGGLAFLTVLTLGWLLVLREAYDLMLEQERWENARIEYLERDGLSATEYWKRHNAPYSPENTWVVIEPLRLTPEELRQKYPGQEDR